MFDFAPVGLGILVVALAFLAIGWRLLPPRVARGAAEDSFNVDAYVIEATLAKTSRFVDKTVHDLESLAEGGVTIIAIVREGGHRYVPAGHWSMFADDVLVLQGDAHALRELAEEAGLEVLGTVKSPGEAGSLA